MCVMIWSNIALECFVAASVVVELWSGEQKRPKRTNIRTGTHKARCKKITQDRRSMLLRLFSYPQIRLPPSRGPIPEIPSPLDRAYFI